MLYLVRWTKWRVGTATRHHAGGQQRAWVQRQPQRSHDHTTTKRARTGAAPPLVQKQGAVAGRHSKFTSAKQEKHQFQCQETLSDGALGKAQRPGQAGRGRGSNEGVVKYVGAACSGVSEAGSLILDNKQAWARPPRWRCAEIKQQAERPKRAVRRSPGERLPALLVHM